MDSGATASPAVRIGRGIAPHEREAVSALYVQAFSRKLGAGIPDAAALRAVVADALRSGSVLVARDADSRAVLGICGVVLDGRPAVDVTWAGLREHLGIRRSLRALLLLAPLVRSAPPRVLLLDGLVVDRAVRGRGVGTALLDAALELAREQSQDAVRLSVVDTNPLAARLYVRRGFQVVEEGGRGPLAPIVRGIYGFSGYRVLERSVR